MKNLPSSETFVSHTNNALVTGTVTVNSNAFSISLPPLSTTAIVLKGSATTEVKHIAQSVGQLLVWPNPGSDILNIELKGQGTRCEVRLTNILGEEVAHGEDLVNQISQIDVSKLQNGIYFISVKDLMKNIIATQKIVVQH